MTSPPSVSTRKLNDDASSNENPESWSSASSTSPLLRSAERLVSPSTTDINASEQGLTGFTGVSSGLSPTLAVLKVTAFQQAIGHPIAYARILMQMGYEPLPACRGKTLFGKETLFYPNVFRYLKYVYTLDGFTGLYRGFGCALLSKMVCWYTTTKVEELLGPIELPTTNDDNIPRWDVCVKKTLREVRCQSWGILLSHPFQVMAIRCMGQFIGREKVYSSINIFQNCQEIYHQQGIGGFFVGLIPRWLLEIATIVISNMLIHILKSQLPAQNEMVPLCEYIAAFVAQTVTYPLSVVTTVTAINGSGLRAGTLPIMPIYANWQDAYKQLGKAEQLKRGSNLFNRVAIGTVGIPTPGKLIRRA